MKKKIAIDTILITFSNFSSKLIAYIYFILLTKSVSPEKIGIFALLTISLLIMELIAGFGIDKILIREISKNNLTYLKVSFIFRLISSLITLIIFISIFYLFYHKIYSIYKLQILIFLSSIIFINLSKNIEAYFIGIGKMIFIAMSQFIEKLNILLFIVLLFFKIINFKKLLCLFLLAEIIRFVFLLFVFISQKLNIKKITIYKKNLIYFFKESSIMFILELIAIIYFRIDTFMLSKLTDLKITGLYHVSYKIFDFFITFFTGFLITIFPYISKKTSIKGLKKILLYGFLIILFISIISSMFRNELLLLFSSTYLKASTSLLILLLTLPFVYINMLFGYFFIANEKQHIYLKIGLPLLFLNIILNYIFIPKYTLNGAAFSTLICEILSSFLFIYFFYRVVRKNLKF